MSWETEHGRKFEVPAFIEFLVKKKLMEDLSWKNDACPVFGIVNEKTGRRLVVWVDHPLRSWREGRDDRFAVQEDDDHTDSSDDLEDILWIYLAKWNKFDSELPQKGPKEWRPAPKRPALSRAELKDFWSDLKDEFYARRPY